MDGMSINISRTFLTFVFCCKRHLVLVRSRLIALIKDGHRTSKIYVKHTLSSASSTAIVPAILAQNHNPVTYRALRGHSKCNYPAH